MSEESEKDVASDVGWDEHAGVVEQNHVGNVGVWSEISCSGHSPFDLIHLRGKELKFMTRVFNELSIEICSVWNGCSQNRYQGKIKEGSGPLVKGLDYKARSQNKPC